MVYMFVCECGYRGMGPPHHSWVSNVRGCPTKVRTSPMVTDGTVSGPKSVSSQPGVAHDLLAVMGGPKAHNVHRHVRRRAYPTSQLHLHAKTHKNVPKPWVSPIV